MLPRNTTDIIAVMSTMHPLIIWYTEAAHWVKATNIKVEPQKSKLAGIASRRGLILVLSFFYLAI